MTRPLPRRLAAWATATLLGVTGAAWGQTPGSEELIAHGNDLRRLGRDAEALAEFRRAWDLSHGAHARAEVGLAEAALGRWAEAAADLDAALATADGWIAEHRAVLEGVRALAWRHLGAVEPRGNVPETQSVTVAAGATAHATVNLRADTTPPTVSRDDAPPAEPPPTPPEPSRPRPVAPWVVGGLAVASIGLGAVAVALQRDLASFGPRDPSWRYTCTTHDECLEYCRTFRYSMSCGDQLEAEERWRVTAWAGFAVGGALAVTSAVLFLTSGGRAPRRAVACGPGLRGVACSVQF